MFLKSNSISQCSHDKTKHNSTTSYAIKKVSVLIKNFKLKYNFLRFDFSRLNINYVIHFKKQVYDEAMSMSMSNARAIPEQNQQSDTLPKFN